MPLKCYNKYMYFEKLKWIQLTRSAFPGSYVMDATGSADWLDAVSEEDEVRQQLADAIFEEEVRLRGLRGLTVEEETDYFNDLVEEAGETTGE